MKPLEFLVQKVSDLTARVERQPEFLWATSTSEPMTIRLDSGESVRVSHSLVALPPAGGRVFCVWLGSRLIVLGVDQT